MYKRPGFTVLELFIVLVIISVLLGLLLPAVQVAREKAREAVCKNNVHQLNLAVALYAQAHKKLPERISSERVGGWMVEILPYIEQRNWEQSIPIGTPTDDAPEEIFQPPSLYRCPRRTVLDAASPNAMWPGHYVLVPHSGREGARVSDSPLSLDVPWVSGPELTYSTLRRSKGPHADGFFISAGSQQGVRFMLNGREVR